MVCVPAQRFGGRSLSDMNTRLWASCVVAGRAKHLFVGGDRGYFDGFRGVGKRLGPFDPAAVAIDAQKPAYIMKAVHTTPEEAVQVCSQISRLRRYALR